MIKLNTQLSMKRRRGGETLWTCILFNIYEATHERGKPYKDRVAYETQGFSQYVSLLIRYFRENSNISKSIWKFCVLKNKFKFFLVVSYIVLSNTNHRMNSYGVCVMILRSYFLLIYSYIPLNFNRFIVNMPLHSSHITQMNTILEIKN